VLHLGDDLVVFCFECAVMAPAVDPDALTALPLTASAAVAIVLGRTNNASAVAATLLLGCPPVGTASGRSLLFYGMVMCSAGSKLSDAQ